MVIPDDRMPPWWFTPIIPLLSIGVHVAYWFVEYTPRSWHPELSAKQDWLKEYRQKKTSK